MRSHSHVRLVYVFFFGNTGISCFWKLLVTSPCFYRRPTLALAFSLTKRCFFTKKGEKQKQRCLFCSESYGGSEGPQQREWPSQAPSREPHSAHRPQAAIALNGTYENLCYSSICFGHPLVRCVPKVSGKPREVIFEVWECSNVFPYKLMVLLLHFAPFWPTKCFIGKLHLCTA